VTRGTFQNVNLGDYGEECREKARRAADFLIITLYLLGSVGSYLH